MKISELYVVIHKYHPGSIVGDTVFQDYETAMLYANSASNLEALTLDEALEKIKQYADFY